MSWLNGIKLLVPEDVILFWGWHFAGGKDVKGDDVVRMQSQTFFLELELEKKKRAVCLFASHGGLGGGRMDEVCFQTGVTHYVCVFSCWAESWMVIMALSTTASSRFSGSQSVLWLRQGCIWMAVSTGLWIYLNWCGWWSFLVGFPCVFGKKKWHITGGYT